MWDFTLLSICMWFSFVLIYFPLQGIELYKDEPGRQSLDIKAKF